MKIAKLSIIDSILKNWPLELNGQLSFSIALSGGIDSIVLLDIFHKISLIKPIKLQAVHVNHNISPNSNQWAEFCTNLCNKYNIPITIHSIKVVKKPSEGLENSARKARYNAFYSEQNSVIVLAHHENDQIETMLSQIMRGSSLANCAGMLNLSQKNNKLFWRPLLNFSKKDIKLYAIENSLQNIEDESNEDNHYLRNFVRNQIIPQLEEYDSNIITKLTQSVYSFQEAVKLNYELAALDLDNCSDTTLNIIKHNFMQLSNIRQLNLLNYYIQKNNLPLISQKSLHEFCRQLHSKQRPEIKLKLTQDRFLISTRNIIYIAIKK